MTKYGRVPSLYYRNTVVTIGSFNLFFFFSPPSSFCPSSYPSVVFFIIHPARPLFRFGDFKTNTVGSWLSTSLREPDKDVILLLICASFFSPAPLSFLRSSFSHYVSSSSIMRYKTGMNQRQLRNKRLMGFN